MNITKQLFLYIYIYIISHQHLFKFQDPFKECAIFEPFLSCSFLVWVQNFSTVQWIVNFNTIPYSSKVCPTKGLSELQVCIGQDWLNIALIM